jgi:DEAD/DEAH box helicase domain-containing protein
VFIAASATIGNPGELAERLVGLPFEVVDQDGAPRGPRWFCFWNPPAYDLERGGRRNPQDDAVLLLRALILQGAQTIAFALSRLGVELLYRYVRDALEREAPRLVERIRPYRGGYLPEERRAIERALFHGRLRAVISTNALELGIDVGSLDAAVLVGYPGTIASTWQQAGRAGRTTADSLAVLVARNDPIDQFLVRHPEYFFGCSPEHAVVDPTNPYILVRHLACAVHELPLDAPADSPLFGQRLPSIVTALLEEGHVRERRGKYYPRSTQNPAPYISLRQISDHTVTIVLQQQSDQGKQQHQVLATVDELSAYQLVYPQAVYVHEGETYVVRELDTEQRIAYVERKETGYYTQAIVETSVHIEHEEQWALYEAGNRPGSADEEQPSHERWPNTLRSAWLGTPTLRERSEEIRFRVGLGELEVSWRTVAFKKIRFHTRENLGLGPVSLPAQSFVTTGLWLTPDSTLLRKVTPLHANPPDVLLALLHLCLHAMPLVSMSDVQDVGGTLDSSNLGALSLFLYDRYPGGLGYCEKAYQRLGELLRLAYEIVRDCPCSSGCPSCVGVGRRLGPHVDPDLARSSIIPDKEGALRLLTTLVHTPLRRKEDLQAIGSF